MPPSEDDWHDDPCQFIRQVVAYWTSKQQEPKGLDLLREAMEDVEVERVDIVTLNHDANIERSLHSWGRTFHEGFLTKGTDRVRNILSLLNATNPIRLLKLHGSSNWCTTIAPLEGTYWAGTSPHKSEATGLRVSADHGDDILVGSMTKLLNYNFGFAADSLLVLRGWLSQHRIMVMSGYGWRDLAVNTWLLDWLGEQDRRCVLLHEGPLDKIQTGLIESHRKGFQAAIESRALRHLSKWLQDAHWPEVRSRIE